MLWHFLCPGFYGSAIHHWPLPLPMNIRHLFWHDVLSCHIMDDTGYAWFVLRVVSSFFQSVKKNSQINFDVRLIPPIPVQLQSATWLGLFWAMGLPGASTGRLVKNSVAGQGLGHRWLPF
jgi:hypothetical protein